MFASNFEQCVCDPGALSSYVIVRWFLLSLLAFSSILSQHFGSATLGWNYELHEIKVIHLIVIYHALLQV